MSSSSPAKARYKKLSPRHFGYCVPCLIRRASLEMGLGMPDPTLYTVSDLAAQTLFTDQSEGENVRSFQLMAKRLEKRQIGRASCRARVCQDVSISMVAVK